MSILLSGYYPEGIVFAADKNATIIQRSDVDEKRYVEPTATKVLAWPYRKAVIGFIGIGELAGLKMDEWVRIFIANNRDFNDIDCVAHALKKSIQTDFNRDYPKGTDVSESHVVIHLGGFAQKQDVHVPVMYHIWNHSRINPKTGQYPPANRTFRISEDVEANFKKWSNSEDYPTRIRDRLQRMVDERRYFWFNNGANVGAFNVFKSFIWQALYKIQDAGFGHRLTGLGAWVAFCKMAVEVFGSYFTHHYDPDERSVGGGVDVEFVPWPT